MCMDFIIQFDQQLFNLLNNEWTHPFLDYIMPFWRSKYLWLPLYIFIISFVVMNFRSNRQYFFFMLIMTIAISDTLSSKIIKPTVERSRPCREEQLSEQIQLRVHCGGGYSFPSSHATNHFALAFFLIIAGAKLIQKFRLLLLIWAGSIAYGQVYVGVHYPIDVLTGSVLGSLVGLIIGYLYKKVPPLEKVTFSNT